VAAGIEWANKPMEHSGVPATGTPRLMRDVEAVEKVNFDRIWSVGRKNDLSECSVFNDIMLARDQETPENTVLTRQNNFSYRLVSRCIA